jgi:hypothetical protein
VEIVREKGYNAWNHFYEFSTVKYSHNQYYGLKKYPQTDRKE